MIPHPGNQLNPLRPMRRGGLVLLAAFSVFAGEGLSQPVSAFLDGVRQAAPLRIDGPIPVHHSTGADSRARTLQDMLANAAAFYRERLGVSATLTLAVLDPAAWKTVTNDAVPYGMPFVNEGVMVLPFRQEGAVVDAYMAHANDLPDAVVKAVEGSRRPFATHITEMVDLIGYHEMGHVYVGELGIAPHNRWFSELLATYFAYAFIAERLPSLARTWQIASQSDSHTAPKHRSLADFERLYMGVGADNYVWYQNRFSERVFAVFATDRLEFLRKVKNAFPRQSNEKLTLDQVLERVEKIQPGFKAWAVSLNEM